MRVRFEAEVLNHDWGAKSIVNIFHAQDYDWRVSMIAALRRLFCEYCGYERHPAQSVCPCGGK